MKFIKLHNSIDNSPIVINMEDVAMVATVEKNRGEIYFREYGKIESFQVNESPERIYTLYNNDDIQFIRLHSNDDNSVVILQREIITVVDTGNENVGSYIYTSDDNIQDLFKDGLTFNETPDKILDIISKTEQKEKEKQEKIR